MGGLFSKGNKSGGGGGKGKKKVTQHDKAVLDLKVQRDKLKQQQKNVSYVTKQKSVLYCMK